MSPPIYGPARAVPLTIRCSVEQRQAFRAAALADGRSLTDWAVRAMEATIQRESGGARKTTARRKKA